MTEEQKRALLEVLERIWLQCDRHPSVARALNEFMTWVLEGLPGTDGGRVEGFPASTVNRMRLGLRKGLASTIASDNGSLTAWRDNCGIIRCEMHRFRIIVDKGSFSTVKDAGEWWAKHLPMIEREGEKK